MSDNGVLSFEWSPPTGKVLRGMMTARYGDDRYTDRLDVADAKVRAGLFNALCERWPALATDECREQVHDELDRLAASEAQRRNSQSQPTKPNEEREIDALRIVRPERFITHDVSGLAIPILTQGSDGPVGRWGLCVNRADGKRECLDLNSGIDLSDGDRLWLHPQPSAPTPADVRALARWSPAARQRWLDGESAPDPADLFKRLCEHIAYFINFPAAKGPGITATLALWVILTYVYCAWDAVPYLYLGGPAHSGKSRVFEVLGRLVFRPLASSNLTGAALFRTLHAQGGTLLFDEAERLRQTQAPDVGEVMSMLLAGYKRGGQAIRLEPVGDTFKTVAFEVYGPKAMACIRGLPGPLLSRCIPITMFRAAANSPKPRRRIDADPAAAQSLRDDLHALALTEGVTWMDLANRVDVCPPMNGRDYELWQPLLALAVYIESHGAEGLLKLMQEHALATIEANQDDQTDDADEILLQVLADEIRAGGAPQPKDILAKAKEDEPDTFDRWSAKGAAGRLARYGLKTNKSHGRRLYGNVSLTDLCHIQDVYSIDLGIEDSTSA